MTPGEPIAVVGMACRFPGAESPADLGRLLRSGQTGSGTLTDARWALWGLPEGDPLRTGFPIGHAGLLEGIELFDRSPFRITANEAPMIDPQQRLALETSWQALEDAGFSPASLEHAPIGVFMGAGSCDYAIRLSQAGLAGAGNPHVANGAQNGAISGRISYCLGLTGPSLTIDTACSSSASAVAIAGDALRLGQCDVALAGGVNALLSFEPFRALLAMRVLSETGKTLSYDNAAAGFVRSEGCGVLVLKRLTCAMRANDRIHAILSGWATGQDGRSNGLSAPSRQAQARVIRRAIEAAGLQPSDIDAIEGHGSATVLGDAIELSALGDVFGGRERTKLVLGAVKATLGHLEAAAGVAGLIKAILMVRDGFMPRQPGFETPSTRLAWQDLPFIVALDLEPWVSSRRVMGVSSFGMNGMNAHLVVTNSDTEEHLAPANDGSHLFLVSAASPESLKARAAQLKEAVEAPNAPLAAIACSTTRRWIGMTYRAGFIAASQGEASAAVDRILGSANPKPTTPLREQVVNIPEDRADLHEALQRLSPGYTPVSFKARETAELPVQKTLDDAILALHLSGAALRPEAIRPANAALVDLPAYPFERQRHWFDMIKPTRSVRG